MSEEEKEDFEAKIVEMLKRLRPHWNVLLPARGLNRKQNVMTNDEKDTGKPD